MTRLSLSLYSIYLQVHNLTKKNYRTTVAECRSLVLAYGAELERHLFRCLLSLVPSKANSGPSSPASVSSPTSGKLKDSVTPVLTFLQEQTEALAGTNKFTSLLIWYLNDDCIIFKYSIAGV